MGECHTTKNQHESRQHTAGVLLAVMCFWVVVKVRELYRSEGKQQVALFLFDLTHAYFDMGLLIPRRDLLRRRASPLPTKRESRQMYPPYLRHRIKV
jgi:hypothetical protein